MNTETEAKEGPPVSNETMDIRSGPGLRSNVNGHANAAGTRNTLDLADAPTDNESAWQGLIAPMDLLPPEERFKEDSQTFLDVAYEIVNREIQRQEAKLQDLRRKRQEMVAAGGRLGLKLPGQSNGY
jgi:hypothetical protein